VTVGLPQSQKPVIQSNRNRIHQELESGYRYNVESDLLGFYCFIKSRHSDPVGISFLKENDVMMSDDKSKVGFPTATSYQCSLVRARGISNVRCSAFSMPDIEVTVQGVQKLLADVDQPKWMGPYNMSALCIGRIKQWICSSLHVQSILIFGGNYQTIGYLANIFAVHEKGPDTTCQKIIDPFH